MLYLSTRNTTDTYTAHRALHEERAPDGGIYIPFRVPVFSADELQDFKGKTQCEIIASVLNRFFSLHLSCWDIEREIGRIPLKAESVNQKVLFAECWRNPAGSVDYLLTAIYALLTGDENHTAMPRGWARIAIGVALLFALYSAAEIPADGIDIAVAAGDLANISAVLFAKEMGLPVHTLICTCNGNSGIWDFVNKGEFNVNSLGCHHYLELIIHRYFGSDGVAKYIDACDRKAIYRIEEDQLQILNHSIFASVVSVDRADATISGLVRSNGYTVDQAAALAYGGLQDYRSYTGINKDTLILALHRPQRDKE